MTGQITCLRLTDVDALDADVVGAKAAGLARALQAGLPVLPGVVVPVEAAAPVIEAVRALLVDGQLGRVRRAAMAVQPDGALVATVIAAAAPLGPSLVVRSSSPMEGDGVWSGAFSSLVGVAPDELPTALRACLASAFSPDAMERAEHQGVPVDALALAVLVQPEIVPDLGGTARVDGTGRVSIAATSGPMRALMEGWVEGKNATVAASGQIVDSQLPPSTVEAVAQLVRTTAERLGHDSVEWATVDGEVWLLQSLRSRATSTTSVATTPVMAAHATPLALALALLTQQYPGPLGEELILPWAVACPDLAARDAHPALDHLDLRDRLARVRAVVNELSVRLWGGSPRAAQEEASRTLRQLRGTDPGQALDRIEALPAPSETQVLALQADLARLREDLVAGALVTDVPSFWRLTLEQLEAAVSGRPVARADRLGVGRWEPFVHAVVRATGCRYDGVAASPGAAAGPVHVVDDLWNQPPPIGRYVLVATSPIPALSPLLWNAAGLITRGGSGHAHLLEFAAAIGVPSVVGVPVPRLEQGGGWFAAVDGDGGEVWLARAERALTAGSQAVENAMPTRHEPT